MEITYWGLILGFCLVITLIAIIILGGVALGGWFVYRTKREPYEPLTGSKKGEVFTLPIGEELAEDLPNQETKIPDTLMEKTHTFLSQIGGSDA